ncbi:hypothetical protein EAG_12889 [Camponotus floridanus]|uniref:Uncharacterized protein n=1 Tax=Camponotus floridanus TaxID=104421 RepID=E2ATR7_CAMFO|nr:hypothetical protein EAG_12889 [Camponotus floridanus]
MLNGSPALSLICGITQRPILFAETVFTAKMTLLQQTRLLHRRLLNAINPLQKYICTHLFPLIGNGVSTLPFAFLRYRIICMRSSRRPRYPKHVLSDEREINPEILQAARNDLRIYVPPREEDPAGGSEEKKKKDMGTITGRCCCHFRAKRFFIDTNLWKKGLLYKLGHGNSREGKMEEAAKKRVILSLLQNEILEDTVILMLNISREKYPIVIVLKRTKLLMLIVSDDSGQTIDDNDIHEK